MGLGDKGVLGFTGPGSKMVGGSSIIYPKSIDACFSFRFRDDEMKEVETEDLKW